MKLDEAAIRALEERAFNAWPALRSAYCDGWLFRFSEGLTRRANSVNAVAPPGISGRRWIWRKHFMAANVCRRSSGYLPWPATSPMACCTGRDTGIWTRPTS